MAQSQTIVISFGRFNPPTTGHESLIKFIEQTAHRFGADVCIYPSQSQDAKKNPLPFAEKVRFLRMLFPHVRFNDNVRIRTPFHALADVAAAGYRNAIVVVGSDRVDEFAGFQKYIESPKSPKYRKDKHIPLDSYRVVAVPVVRGGGSGVAGMSASKQRAFAVAGDYESFKQGVPGQNDRIARILYTAVRQHMQIKETARLRATIDKDMLRLPIVEDTELHPNATITEARLAMPLKGHAYHKLSDAELRYIIKDAGEAAKAMKDHNPRAESKYLDQVDDAHSVLYYRRQGGKQIKETQMKEATETSICPSCHRKVAKGAGWCPHCKQDIEEATSLFGKKGAWGPAVGKAVSAFGKNLAAQSRYTEKQCTYLWKWANSYANGPKREYALRISGEMKAVGPSILKTKEGMFGDRNGIDAVKVPSGLSSTEAAKVRHDARIAAEDCLSESVNPSGSVKPPSEVDRLKTRQKQDEIALKQRQANELMAAKLRDVQQKSREQQNKATAPKPASR